MPDDRSPQGDTLAHTFATVVHAHGPAPDDWEVVRRRVAASDAGTPLALVSGGDKRRRSRRLLAAAALVAAVSGLGAGLVLATRHHDRSVRTATLPAADPPATGWYVPTDLPTAWSVDAVEVVRQDDACPCRVALWANADRTTSLSLTRTRVPAGTTSPPADQMAETPVPVDLGPVDGARVAEDSGGWLLEWYEGDSWVNVRGYGIDRDRAEAIGRALVADPDRSASPVPGLDLVGDRATSDRSQPNAYVTVRLTTPAGHTTSYRLSAPATFGPSHPFEPVDLPGQDLPLYHELPWSSEVRNSPTGAGHWPGADVSTGLVLAPTATAHEPVGTVDDDAEARTLLASLRPATAEQWQAFVAGATDHDPRLDTAPTLESLLALPADH